MPRPLWKPLAVALALAAIPPPVLHAALAATAGTLFEAAPFVLLAEAAAGPGLRLVPAFAALAGCGCTGGRWPGALSLPATALAWLAFGPAVALGRLGAGLVSAAIAARWRDRPTGRSRAAMRSWSASGSAPAGAGASVHRAGESAIPRTVDAFTELAALAPPAFCASLAAQALTAQSAALHAGGAAGDWLAFGAGLLLGAVAPCATAGVAIAAALAGPLPPAASGLLVTSGLLGLRPGRRARSDRAGHRACASRTDHSACAFHAEPPTAVPSVVTARVRTASLLLAAALAALALRGPSGLVSPRLLPLAVPAAALALIRLRASRAASPASASAFVPALMAGAILTGSPAPVYRLDATEAAAAFPGSRFTFTGVALAAGRETVIERFAIACCRIDAAPVSLTLDRRLSVPDGAWLTVEGTVMRDPAGGLVLRASGWRRVPRPADPFMYR